MNTAATMSAAVEPCKRPLSETYGLLSMCAPHAPLHKKACIFLGWGYLVQMQSHLLLCDLGGGSKALCGPRPEVRLSVPYPLAVQSPQLMALHIVTQQRN